MSGVERHLEHLNQATSNSTTERAKSHMWNHWQEVHGGDQTQFHYKILRTFRTPLSRQCVEAMAIKLAAKRGEKILDSKDKYTRCYLPELTFPMKEVKNLKDQEGGHGQNGIQEVQVGRGCVSPSRGKQTIQRGNP